jgi:hypothetical protein
MELAFVGVICACGGAVAVLTAAAALLKLAVVITNRVVRPTRQESRGEWSDWDWDDWDDEYVPGPQKPKEAIPALGLGKALVIVVLTGMVGALGFVLLGFAAEEAFGLRMRREETKLAVLILDLPLAALTLTVLLLSMLPTNFWRAAMVAFVYGILFLAFAAGVGSMIFVIGVVFD